MNTYSIDFHDLSGTEDDVINGVREALARLGYQVCDAEIIERSCDIGHGIIEIDADPIKVLNDERWIIWDGGQATITGISHSAPEKKRMLVTVVTKYDQEMSEHYVAVIEGKVDEEQRAKLRKSFDCPPKDVDEPDSNYMLFREVQTTGINECNAIYNIDGEQ